VKITPFRARLIGVVGSRGLGLLGRTWRITVVHGDRYSDFARARTPFITAFWHRFILPMAFTHRGRDASVLISRHGDGELISSVVERMGYRTVRGSSSRGGARAMLELARLPDGVIGLTPDGPRGPSGIAQPGIAWLAAHSQRPIVPIGAAVSSAWLCRSWDRFVVPKPGSRVVVSYGEPLRIPAELSEDEIPATCERVSRALDLAGQEAMLHLANPRPS
jgi:lysophospholipid acyltransferase (LPLAT)-like uncharacterized protein